MKKYLIALLGLFLLTACSSDDKEEEVVAETNANKNVSSNTYAANNLEFPQLKGGVSKLIVYTATSSDEQKFGMNFAVEWDCGKKSNRWTCYRFDTSNRETGKRGNDGKTVVRWYPSDKEYPGSIYGDKKDPNRWYPFDYVNLTDDERLEDMYYGTGCDHGHICPSADRYYSQEANIETFYMTNMQPQYSDFNQNTYGLWMKMENKTRTMAKSLSNTDTLYIVKGGTIDNASDIITKINGQLIVPKYFFAAYLMYKPLRGSTNRSDPSNYKAMAYWFEHTKSANTTSTLEQCMISIDELERKTGIDFFCNLPDNVEDKVESVFYPDVW